jgi:lysyl-tRNA synthetase class 2
VQRWLVTSPEYHCKRLLSAGMTHIYAMQHVFRSGERGAWHNPEFMMLEWYRVGASYRDIVADCRALLRHCALALRRAQLPVAASRPPYDPARPWQTLSVRQAVVRWAGFDPGRADDDAVVRARALRAGLEVQPQDTAADVIVRALVERVEPALADLPPSSVGGVVLDRWPASMASLARRFAHAPHLAERFEIYLQGIELANGFSELVDPHEQRERFEVDLQARRRTGRPIYPIDERFLRALHDGCPPAAGVALGVDRLVMALTGSDDIAGVTPFVFERA